MGPASGRIKRDPRLVVGPFPPSARFQPTASLPRLSSPLLSCLLCFALLAAGSGGPRASSIRFCAGPTCRDKRSPRSVTLTHATARGARGWMDLPDSGQLHAERHPFQCSLFTLVVYGVR